MTSSELLSFPARSVERLPAGLYLTVAGQHFRLHTPVNLDYVEAQIKAAMGRGDAYVIETDAPVEGGEAARIVLSGAALPFVVLWEQPDVAG
jgi:hypothetical protein